VYDWFRTLETGSYEGGFNTWDTAGINMATASLREKSDTFKWLK
jgi:hypothetical protein